MSENQQPKYSLKKKFVQVPIEQEDGTVVVYEIRRAPGDLIESYLEANSRRMDAEVDEHGKVRIKQIKSYKDSYVSLLKICLYRDDQLVPDTVIRKFPFDVQQGLFEEAQIVNALNKEGEKSAKNSPSGIEPGESSLPASESA